MAADQDTRVRAAGTSDERAQPPHQPSRQAPPQAVMGLLNYITATSMDEDYEQASRRHGAAASTAPSRPGRVAMVVLALFGALVATAAVQTSRSADESAVSQASLVTQVRAHTAELNAKRARVAVLTRSVESLQNRNLAATTRGRSVRDRIGRLSVTAGTVAVTGPGVRVVVDDAPHATRDNQRVLDQDLQKLVNALWLVGAEAVAINDERLTNLTAIRQAGSAITVNFVSLRRPYTVSAIGDEDQMAARLLDTDGGKTWLTLRASFGLQFDVNSEDSMTLPSAKQPSLRYARPVEPLR